MKSRTSRIFLPSFGVTCIFLCSLLLAFPAFSAPPGPDGNRGHLNRLLHNQKVIDHLGLTGDQASAAQTASNDVTESQRAAFERALEPETKAERAPLVARVFMLANAQTYERLKGVMDVHQYQRLKQIEVQTAGMRAFGRAEVIDVLGLTASQQEELRALADRTGERLSAIQRSLALSAAEKSDESSKIRKSALQEARERLSVGQWLKWELLSGAEFAP